MCQICSWYKFDITYNLNMSKFFDNTDLDINKAESIVSSTLNKCDDGELYLENSKSEAIILDDNKIKSSNFTNDVGYGFRAITGDVVAYSHSNDISENSLKNSSANLKSSLSSNKGNYDNQIKNLEIANNLFQLYEYCRAQIIQAFCINDYTNLKKARAALDEIIIAWDTMCSKSDA